MNINLSMLLTPPAMEHKHQNRNMLLLPVQARVKSNVLAIEEKTCSCGRWQEYKYPRRHAIAYFMKWDDMPFPDIMQVHVHDYYKNKSMQQIYAYNMFPLIHQFRYDGETNLTTLGTQQPGHLKRKRI